MTQLIWLIWSLRTRLALARMTSELEIVLRRINGDAIFEPRFEITKDEIEPRREDKRPFRQSALRRLWPLLRLLLGISPRNHSKGVHGVILNSAEKIFKSQFLEFVRFETFDILNDLTIFLILLAAFAIESGREWQYVLGCNNILS